MITFFFVLRVGKQKLTTLPLRPMPTLFVIKVVLIIAIYLYREKAIKLYLFTHGTPKEKASRYLPGVLLLLLNDDGKKLKENTWLF